DGPTGGTTASMRRNGRPKRKLSGLTDDAESIKRAHKPKRKTRDTAASASTGGAISPVGTTAGPIVSTGSTTALARGNMPVATASVNLRGSRTLPDVQNDIGIAIGATPGYSNDIIHEPSKSYVRLADVSIPGQPPKKLLDATVDNVTVYRRFTEDPSLTIEQRARVILKSMGVPASPGFDLPDKLIINGKETLADFNTMDKNSQLYKIVQEMFRQYDQAVNNELNLGNASGTNPP
ncbi:MAG TPA: hypothetical protein VHD33_08400, partial [Legionellaceae bacterium]|nr:hypothetical protein [Legionellaceae bacterium]